MTSTTATNRPRGAYPERRPALTPASRRVAVPRRIYVPVRQSIDGVSVHAAAQKKTLQPVSPLTPPAVKKMAVQPRHAKRLGKSARRLHILTALSAKRTTAGTISGWRQLFSKRTAYALCAVAVVAVTMYVSVDTWFTNRAVSSQQVHAATPDTKDDNATAISGDERPSEQPLPKNTLTSYKVAGPNPRVLSVKKIGLSARVLPMTVDRNNALQAPASIFDTGWYTGSVKPGETGAVLIDAHSSGGTAGAAFDKLHTLATGDVVTVETGAGTIYNYRVVAKETQPKDKVDMQKALLPYGNALKGLNLITCAGQFTDHYTNMTDRLVVYTVLQ